MIIQEIEGKVSKAKEALVASFDEPKLFGWFSINYTPEIICKVIIFIAGIIIIAFIFNSQKKRGIGISKRISVKDRLPEPISNKT